MITQRNISVEILTEDSACTTLWNRDGSNYFLLSPGDFYAIRIRNETEDDGSVTITLNNSDSARFQIRAGEADTFETLISNGPRFRFRRENSAQAARQGFRIGDESNGLVEITFVPERRLPRWRLSPSPPLYRSAIPQGVSAVAGEYKSVMPSALAPAMSAAPVKSGVTTFEGRSDDVYRMVSMPPLDYSRKVSIVFRLVAKPEDRSRRRGISSPRWPPRLDF